MKESLFKYPITWLFCALLILNLGNAESFAQNKIRVALFLDKGAHPGQLLCTNLAKEQSISLTCITGDDVCADCLNKFDVLFVPGGSGKREALSLTPEGQKKVRIFVRNGGIYLGVCAGCYLASCARPEYLGLLPMTTCDKEHWRRGKAVLPIEFTNLGMQIFGMQKANANVIYHNGPVLKAYDPYVDKIAVLSYFRDEVVAPGGKTGVMTNAPAMVLARYGDGLVLGISPHPEATNGLSTIELTAINWLYNHRPNSKFASVRTSQQPATQDIVKTTTNGKALSDLIYKKAENIFLNTTVCHYKHLHEEADAQANMVNGKFHIDTDCSGFVSYVLDSVAPKHYSTLQERTAKTYPHASTYANFFCQLPMDASDNGWMRIADYNALRPGDIIAWQRSDRNSSLKKGSGSGHVMIVADRPAPVTTQIVNGNRIKYTSVFVLDSSSVEHFPPQTLPPLTSGQWRDGLGKGYIRLILDNQNQVIGFWEGTYSHEKETTIKGPSYTNVIAFARLISNLN